MSQSFDPFKHHRKSIRYNEWDYRTPGYYFITICTANRQPVFDNPMFRQIVERRLQMIPRFATQARLDQWIVMPDHAHINLQLLTWPRSKSAEPEKRTGLTNVQSGSIGAIVGSFKSQVSREINDIRGAQGNSIWQSGYWDRIVRNENELARIRQYIVNNPERWEEDRDDLDAILKKMIHHP